MREPAGERADYWRAHGHDFNPDIFTAEEMDQAAAEAQARALFSRALELAAWAVIGVVAHLVPLAIASSRRHRYRWPITALCLGTPLALAGFALLPRDPAHAALVGVLIPAFAVVAWITALVWSVMPGQGRTRPQAGTRARPVAPPPDRPQPVPAAAAAPAVDDFRAD